MTGRDRPEPLTIRPPSEWRSLLLRSTRGCNWNHCRFCGVYAALGEPEFSVRPLEDVLADIDWYVSNMPGLETAFIGDADPLVRPVDESVAIISGLREKLPHLARITAYARAATLFKIGEAGARRLAAAGLTRVHIGLESGDLQTLRFHRKGQSPKLVEQAVTFVKSAGVEVSYYVLLGLGGRDRWKEHIDGTVQVINRTDPQFIRLRRIWLFTPDDSETFAACPLVEEIRTGRFVPQTPEGTVHEVRRLIDGVTDARSELISDHANNYINVHGTFPQDRVRMLSEIDTFLALPQKRREAQYAAVGSRI